MLKHQLMGQLEDPDWRYCSLVRECRQHPLRWMLQQASAC